MQFSQLKTAISFCVRHEALQSKYPLLKNFSENYVEQYNLVFVILCKANNENIN